MIKCWWVTLNIALTILIMIYRNPEPKSRPHFRQITQLLDGNSSYLLGWSDEDKQIGGEDAMKLGGALEHANSLYNDLQCTYQ